MNDSVALRRYRQRHMEADLPLRISGESRWRQVLVLPAYRESPALLEHLRKLPVGDGRSLVILVLNRPDRDSGADANRALRARIGAGMHGIEASPTTMPLNPHTDLFLLDLEKLRGPTPASQGVGLARKAGCDLALEWTAQGVITGQWIGSTDADALLPNDYYDQLDGTPDDAVAAVFPFRHIPGGDEDVDRATALYELRLHHHVLGLEYAGSPYAYHALGSCLAVTAEAYAQVRGFPKRAGAEDFYLLNKLAKLGPIARLTGSSVRIRSRQSSRVPFGTGPAVQAIATAGHATAGQIFYHPLCYAALRSLLQAVDELAAKPGSDIIALLSQQGLPMPEAETAKNALEAMGLRHALEHCRRQGKSPGGFQRHFHQWFDGFLTLKFIHALRDSGWPMQSLAQLATLQPFLWPTPDQDIEQLRSSVERHWQWR